MSESSPLVDSRSPARQSPGLGSFQTRAVRGWGRADGRAPSLLPPIVQSATFAQGSPGEAAGHTYSRASNPTVAALETALGAIEDAPPAVAFASGLAATHALALATLAGGDHAIVSRACYGGTVRLFRQVLAPLGISASFVDATDVRAIGSAITPRTRLILVETPANPTLDVVDVAAVGRLANAARIPLAVDNTFLTAFHQRPLDLGATVSLLSTTKWIDGHHATIGGALVAREPALLERLRFLRKSVGSIQAPFDAWLTLQGSKTLATRLERHAASALEIARWLDGRTGVARVLYPGLRTHPGHEIARRQHRNGHGGVISFELEGGRDAAIAFARRLELVTLAESLGGAESLLTHPVTMTHGDVPPAERRAIGITDGLLRLSVGLEGVDDLRRDLAQALDAARSAAPLPVAAGAATEEVACG
jgi:cystathionine beta-lyase/cystathionine gamma-synthase